MTDFRPTNQDVQLVETFCDKHLKGQVSMVYRSGSRIVLNRRQRRNSPSLAEPPAISFQRTGTESYRLELIQLTSEPKKRNRVLGRIGKTAPLRPLLDDLEHMHLPGKVIAESSYDPRAIDREIDAIEPRDKLGHAPGYEEELELQGEAERREQENGAIERMSSSNLDSLICALQRRDVAEGLLGAPLVFQRRIGTAELCIPEGVPVTPPLVVLMNEGCPPEYEIDSGELALVGVPPRPQRRDRRFQRLPGEERLTTAMELLDADAVARDDRWEPPERLPGALLSWLELYDLRVSLNAILTNTPMSEAFPARTGPNWVTGPLPGATPRVAKPSGTTDLGWFRAIAASVGLNTPSAAAQVAGLGRTDSKANATPCSYDFSTIGAIPRGALDYFSNKTESQRFWDD